MTHKPLIGISFDWQEKGTFSSRPHYALRTDYFDAIYRAGGLPVGIPYLNDGIEEYLETIDGLLIPGGGFTSPDDWYEKNSGENSYQPSPRADFDIALSKKALEKNMPFLGICAGMQILGGIYGCKMYKDLHAAIETDIDHLNEKPAEETAHNVTIAPGTRLHNIINTDVISVNTAHTEAISTVVENIKVNATAPDGIIEGIEATDKKFAIGVQWHPEFFLKGNNPHTTLFKAFIDATR